MTSVTHSFPKEVPMRRMLGVALCVLLGWVVIIAGSSNSEATGHLPKPPVLMEDPLVKTSSLKLKAPESHPSVNLPAAKEAAPPDGPVVWSKPAPQPVSKPASYYGLSRSAVLIVAMAVLLIIVLAIVVMTRPRRRDQDDIHL